jgi:hypothetical protein
MVNKYNKTRLGRGWNQAGNWKVAGMWLERGELGLVES